MTEWFDCGSSGDQRVVLDLDHKSGIHRDGYGRILAIRGGRVGPFREVAQAELGFLMRLGFVYAGARCWGKYATAEVVRFESPVATLDILCVYVQNQLEGPFLTSRADPHYRLDLEPLTSPHGFNSDVTPAMSRLASWLQAEATGALKGDPRSFEALLARGARLAGNPGWSTSFDSISGIAPSS